MGARSEVLRNDADPEILSSLRPSRLVISPGPKRPVDAGISGELLRRYAGRIPILGVCLGHQCIGEVFGGKVGRAPRLMHGKTSAVYHDGQGLYRGLPNPFSAMRYHSLVISETPPDFLVSARTDRGEIMGIRHRSRPIDGVQFHPESYRTESGLDLLRNFLRRDH